MVELKKKVTLKKKVVETAAPNRPIQPEPNIPSAENNGNWKKWGGFVLLAAVIVIAFILLKPDNSGDESFVESQTIAESVAKPTNETPNPVAETPIAESTSDDKTVSDNATDENKNDKSSASSDQQVSTNEKQSKTNSSVNKEASSVPSRKTNIPSGSLEEKAMLVIRGDFGNGEERKINLGSEYSTIQGKVNEMYAKGLVN